MAKITYPKDKINLDISLMIQELNIKTERLFQDLQLYKNTQIANGLTAKQADVLIADMVQNQTDIFNTFVNSSKSKIRELEKTLVARPIQEYDKKNPDAKYEWQLGSVKTSHCEDCIYLSSLGPRTIKEWRALGFGLPREGGTICSVGCHCLLQPV